MNAISTLRGLRCRGYAASVSEGKLKLRGPGKPPEELEAQVLAHRDDLIRLIDDEVLVDEREVFALARQRFGLDEKGGDRTTYDINDKTSAAITVDEFVEEYVERLGRIRTTLLKECWRHWHGGASKDIEPAIERLGYRRLRLKEYRNAEFVFAERGA